MSQFLSIPITMPMWTLILFLLLRLQPWEAFREYADMIFLWCLAFQEVFPQRKTYPHAVYGLLVFAVLGMAASVLYRYPN